MNGGARIAIVDELKAICIVLVIIQHAQIIPKETLLFRLIITHAVPVFLMLSGYVYAIGAGGRSMRAQFARKRMLRKLARLAVPTGIAFLLNWAIQICAGKAPSPLEFLVSLPAGRFGTGSYYFALMVEFTLLAPLLHRLIARMEFHGVLLAGLFNFLYDVFCAASRVPASLYRVIVLRYLLVIALGMYAGQFPEGRFPEKKIGNQSLALMLIAGIVYCIMPVYWNYQYRIYTYDMWQYTSMISSLYPFAVAYMLLAHRDIFENGGGVAKALQCVGRASYHIMYAQMSYYLFCNSFHIPLARFGAAMLPVNIAISICLGILFRKLDDRFLTGRILRKLAS